MGNPTWNGSSLGTVTKEEIEVRSGVTVLPIPKIGDETSIAQQAEGFDVFGASKLINLTGFFTGAASDLKIIKDDFEAVARDTQASAAYVSDVNGTDADTFFINARFVLVGGTPTKMDYTMALAVATDI